MTHHASLRCTNWWVFLFMEYNKPFLSVSDQVNLLEERGLIIDDRDTAMEFLKVVSYYRFSSYTFAFEEKKSACRSHCFRPKSCFSDIIQVYEFDHCLRLHSLKAIEAIEISFRTKICYHLAEVYGSHWYEDQSLFIDVVKHSQFLVKVDREIKRSREVFIKHYSKTYKVPQRPPAWMIIELLSLGTVSMMFTNIKDRKVRKRVADEFGVPEKVLVNWIKEISFLRNLCAHHARIWNRQYSPLAVPKPMKCEVNVTRRYKDYIWMMNKLLLAIHRDERWRTELKDILVTSNFIDKRAMGFVDDWENDPVWVI